jgi:hypothetical protein
MFLHLWLSRINVATSTTPTRSSVRIYSRSLYLELFHQTLPCVYNLFACSTSLKLSIGRQQSSNHITYIDQNLRLQRHNAIWMDPAESNTSISILLQVGMYWPHAYGSHITSLQGLESFSLRVFLRIHVCFGFFAPSSIGTWLNPSHLHHHSISHDQAMGSDLIPVTKEL